MGRLHYHEHTLLYSTPVRAVLIQNPVRANCARAWCSHLVSRSKFESVSLFPDQTRPSGAFVLFNIHTREGSLSVLSLRVFLFPSSCHQRSCERPFSSARLVLIALAGGRDGCCSCGVS